MKKCINCDVKKEDVIFYPGSSTELPEDAESGYYCKSCVEELNKEWWKEESEAYCDYNCDDCGSFNFENNSCARGHI